MAATCLSSNETSTADGLAKVAFIGGSGRSGTTLLALALGNVAGCVAVGELHWLWERGLLRNELCGCGAHFRDCAFWSTVGTEAFGGWDQVDARELGDLRNELLQLRTVPLSFASRVRPDYAQRIAAYAEHMERLYLAIRKVTNCDVIVDSSKSASAALLLARMRLDPYLVHVARDSRGVVFSWSKRVVRPEVTDEVVYMGRRSTTRAAVGWVALNAALHVVGRAAVPRLFVSYESFVASPRAEMDRIAEFLGLAPERDLSFLDDHALPVAPMHTVAGNPLRFRHGSMPISSDEEWRQKMARGDRMLVSALTWPLEVTYGKSRNGRRAHGSAGG
ncbi:MAG TPA: sulfotransferase [Solirubrobacteraceae bacterium]|nr:sulfotransferase [Solirubrobacteraceae bacterium]